MIRADHTAVMTQFHKLGRDLDDSQRTAIIGHLCSALEVHAKIEEDVFYPALQAQGLDTSGLDRDTMDKSVPEHDEMRRLIDQVRGLNGQREAQDQALQALMNAVMHHMADEETRLLPGAERMLGASRLADLGARMTAHRLELAGPHAGQRAGEPGLAAPARTAWMTLGALAAGTWLVHTLRRSRPAAS